MVIMEDQYTRAIQKTVEKAKSCFPQLIGDGIYYEVATGRYFTKEDGGFKYLFREPREDLS